MAQSSRSATRQKPEKPRKDFPLFAHANGQWAKKVRQVMYYFGPWEDPRAALEKWLDQKDDLYAGRTPTERKEGLTVGDLLDHFRFAKEKLAATGDITKRTLGAYIETCDRLAKCLSLRQLVESFTASDFEKVREALAVGRNPTTLRGYVLTTRMIFKYGFESGLMSTPARFGQSFKIPSKAALRRAKHAKGKRMFEAADLRQIIAEADQPMKAMILLGVNCGFGATDLANLPHSALDLTGGWVEFPRVKTSVDRLCPLWPETVDALKEAIELRPDPRDPADSGLVFLTRCGQRWSRTSDKGQAIDAVACEMNKLLKQLKLHRPGLGHYALRHTLQTIGGAVRDQVAMDLIFGHVDGSMAAGYRQRIENEDERLLAITNHVRAWLFPAKQWPR